MSDARVGSLLLGVLSEEAFDSPAPASEPGAVVAPGFDRVVIRVIRDSFSSAMLSSVLKSADQGFDWIGVTGTKNRPTVQMQLETAADQMVSDRQPLIVYSSVAVPSEFLKRIPLSLHSLLRVTSGKDLLLFPSEYVGTSSSGKTLQQLLQPLTLRCFSIPQPVDVTRLPDAGPKSLGAAPTIRTQIRDRVSLLGFSSMKSKCMEAGLLLLNDFLDESHEISQTMEGKGNPRTGDYWHGIMHRREPDAGNASYWFRRVGQHPAMDELAVGLTQWMRELMCSSDEIELAQQTVVKAGTWDPMAMIQLSTSALRSPGSHVDSTCRTVQYLEMLNLLSWTLSG